LKLQSLAKLRRRVAISRVEPATKAGVLFSGSRFPASQVDRLISGLQRAVFDDTPYWDCIYVDSI
jgi:hypothetical protein